MQIFELLGTSIDFDLQILMEDAYHTYWPDPITVVNQTSSYVWLPPMQVLTFTSRDVIAHETAADRPSLRCYLT